MYVTPEVEIVTVSVERGFEDSVGGEDHGDGGKA